MRKLLTTFVCVWFTLAVWAEMGFMKSCSKIPQISEIQKLDVKAFSGVLSILVRAAGRSFRSRERDFPATRCCWGINNRMLR